MIRINRNFKKLQTDYLFSRIAKKVAARESAGKKVIKLGIGDVTLPLPPALIQAFHDAVEEMGHSESFRGYGPEQGYPFLREKIAKEHFSGLGCSIDADDIFISDGAKCDTGNFQELFAGNIAVAVPDPVYPVYVDTNVMAGRTGKAVDGRYEGLIYLEGNEGNGFVPSPQGVEAELVYLCYPNNPTGTVATKTQLGAWVDWARKHKALILFDAAYQAFIRDRALPRSIYEISGAETCAVEFNSFSKSAGFTGVRCAFTVVPSTVEVDGVKLKDLWNRRCSTKFNGVSYPVQRAAAAAYSPEGRHQVEELTNYYMNNADSIRTAMAELGLETWGGENSPYVWVKTGEESWETFDRLLDEAGVVITPGSGFGRSGEGFIRISAFNHKDRVEEGLERMVKVLKSRFSS